MGYVERRLAPTLELIRILPQPETRGMAKATRIIYRQHVAEARKAHLVAGGGEEPLRLTAWGMYWADYRGETPPGEMP
jgi:hypothetical protein